MTAPPDAFRPLPTLVAVLLLLPGAAAGQERGIQAQGRPGTIEILAPTEWRGVEARPMDARAGGSIRVEGYASHPAGVNGVMINGDRAAIQDAGPGRVRFTGFASISEGTPDVEVAAFANGGGSFLTRYPVRVVAADRLYEAPDQAFGEANGFGGKRWAVVVGVSAYRDPRIQSLEYADADARSFYDFLVSERAGLGGVPEENVVLLLNEDATYRNLRTALFSFLKEATEDDQVFIYIAGHGAPDPERLSDLYLLPYDTDLSNISGTAFPMQDVAEATRGLMARDIIVITDACHSAGVGGQVGTRSLSENQINQAFLYSLNASAGGLTIFTASQATQVSFEGEQWGGGHGVFTHFLLEGLNGAADEDRDRIVTLVEMMEYTRERVRRETRNAQIPTISQTAFDQALPVAAVLDPEVYARIEAESGPGERVALPGMFARAETAAPPGLLSQPPFVDGLVAPVLGFRHTSRPRLGYPYVLGAAAVAAAGLAASPAIRAVSDAEAPVWSYAPLDDAAAWSVVFGAASVWIAGAEHARRLAQAESGGRRRELHPPTAFRRALAHPVLGWSYLGRPGTGAAYTVGVAAALVAPALYAYATVCDGGGLADYRTAAYDPADQRTWSDCEAFIDPADTYRVNEAEGLNRPPAPLGVHHLWAGVAAAAGVWVISAFHARAAADHARDAGGGEVGNRGRTGPADLRSGGLGVGALGLRLTAPHVELLSDGTPSIGWLRLRF